jgi:ABC-type Fe3+-hydroxamate transport system substrate-binding protein
MRKFILSAAAVAACAFGGVAQADVIDSVGNAISSIFGIPYDPRPSGTITHVYTDAYGRQVQVDAAGRHTVVTQPTYIDQYGRAVPYGTPYAMAPQYDNDGDGFANQYDRVPNDPRYR